MKVNLIHVERGYLYNQAYIDAGDGPPVIFLHGLFGKLGMWRSSVEALMKNYRVVVPRLPIFELPAESTNIRHLAEVLHEFIECHNLRDVNLVGHAIGGQVALMYANYHPRNVDRIVLTGSAGLFESLDFKMAMSPEATNYDFINKQVRSAFYNAEDAPEQLVDEIYASIQSSPRRLNISSLIQSSKTDTVEVFLNNLDHRVMLLWGLQDKITPPEVALHFHDFLRNSEVRFIEKCGHLPMVEEPEIFSKHLLSFLD
ncbi:MAG TPA: alpha/beta hydrolase [Cyclobacteriaceae bacterium]|nr:alpha/beta hydrolase [Cyclobacteriaceae bacterium]